MTPLNHRILQDFVRQFIFKPIEKQVDPEASNPTESPAIADWHDLNSQDSWLEQQVGKPMAARIRQLLAQHYWECPQDKKYGDEFPNCFGTALWVSGIDTGHAPQMYGHPEDGQWDEYDNFSYAEGTQNLVALIESNGYDLIGTERVLSVNPRIAASRRHHLDDIPELEPKKSSVTQTRSKCLTLPLPMMESFDSLQPGDLLFFGNVLSDSLDLVHAVVYLGTSATGEHIIFEKESSGCGAISQFRLTTLEAYLQEASTTEDIQPIFDFATMWIYRAAE